MLIATNMVSAKSRKSRNKGRDNMNIFTMYKQDNYDIKRQPRNSEN